MIAAAAPDMGGSREQTVWFRFQQIECAVPGATLASASRCSVTGQPQYYDTYVFFFFFFL
jgi:hypothetical protein